MKFDNTKTVTNLTEDNNINKKIKMEYTILALTITAMFCLPVTLLISALVGIVKESWKVFFKLLLILTFLCFFIIRLYMDIFLR